MNPGLPTPWPNDASQDSLRRAYALRDSLLRSARSDTSGAGRARLDSLRRRLPRPDTLGRGALMAKFARETARAESVVVAPGQGRRPDLSARDSLGADFGYGNERLEPLLAMIETFLERKAPGQVDSDAVLMVKRRIREVEAISAIETLNLDSRQARFLNMPFYQTGKVRKDPIGPRDVEIILELLEEVKPEIILVAGALSDPPATRRMCGGAVERALAGYGGDPPEVWYYRGAWQEWPVAEADLLVPMSEEELRVKISAIFKHQSQKDRAPFPGVDEREFWQRVEERNRETARLVDRLGLPEYFAMEALRVGGKGGPGGDRETGA